MDKYSGDYMPIQTNTLKIRTFLGIDQSLDQNDINPQYTAHAHNVDYSKGSIRPPADTYDSSYTPPYGTTTTGEIRDVFNIHAFYKRESGIDHTWLVALCGEYGTPATHSIWVRYLGSGAYHPDTWQKIQDVTTSQPSGNPEAIKFSFANYQDGDTGLLLFTSGGNDLYKWDATYTGSTANQATKLSYTSESVHAPRGTMLALYKERVFVAGVVEHPDRLYWSNELQPDEWTINPSNPDDAGYIDVLTWDGDYIRAIVALNDELLIFKKRSLFRLSGSAPSDYALIRVADVGTENQYTVAKSSDMAFFMSHIGLLSFDGVNIGKPIPWGKVELLDYVAEGLGSLTYNGNDDTKVFAGRSKVLVVPGMYGHGSNGTTEESKIHPELIELDLTTGVISFRNGILCKVDTENYPEPHDVEESIGSSNYTIPINYAIPWGMGWLCSGPASGTASNYGKFIFHYIYDDMEGATTRIRWLDTPITLDSGYAHMFHAVPETDFGISGKRKLVSKITVSGKGGTVKITPVCDGVAKTPITLTLPDDYGILRPKTVHWRGRKIGMWIENVDGSQIEVTDIELDYILQGG